MAYKAKVKMHNLGIFIKKHHIGLMTGLIAAVLAGCLIHFGTDGMYIPYFWDQVLSMDAMLIHPLDSLLVLHAQPPLLNILFYLIHLPYLWFKLDPRIFATIFNYVIGFFALRLWYLVAFKVSRSRLLAFLVLLLLLLDPSFYVVIEWFFYTHDLLLLQALFFFLLLKFMEEKNSKYYVLFMVNIAVIVLLRSLYHPVYYVCCCLMLLLFSWQQRLGRKWAIKSLGLAAAVFAVLILPWMVKNEIMFNSTAFSSWLGLNLRMGSNRVGDFIESKYKIDEGLMKKHYKPYQLAILRNTSATASILKTNKIIGTQDTRFNYNHYAVPPLSDASVKDELKFYYENSDVYFKRCIMHINSFDFPTFTFPPYGDGFNPYSGQYPVTTRYRKFYDTYIHGSWLRKYTSTLLCADSNPYYSMYIKPSMFFLFYLVGFPYCLLKFIRNRKEEFGYFYLFTLFANLFFFMMILFIDGRESQRMRWPLQPLYLIVTLGLLRDMIGSIGGFGTRLGRKKREPAPANITAGQETPVAEA